MHVIAIGDAFVTEEHFRDACKVLEKRGVSIEVMFWGPRDRGQLEETIRQMEEHGPSVVEDAEEISQMLQHASSDTALLVDFCPILGSAMSRLSMIGVCRSGYNNIDMNAAAVLGVPVVNVAGRNANAVAEFTIGMILSETREIARSHADLLRGKWRKDLNGDPMEIRGKRIGLIGFGEIGRLVAEKLSAWKCDIAYFDPNVGEPPNEVPHARSVDLHTLLTTSDILSVHARLTEATEKLISYGEFAKMKRGAYLINTARAGIVEENALVEALEAGTLRGAALDVFNREPLPANHPFLRLHNVTLTSHLAGSTAEALSESPRLLVERMLKLHERGDASVVVNRDVVG